MKKMIVIGSPGTGKSTLAKKLADSLIIKLYHLDKLFWKPQWKMSTKEEQREILYDIVKQNSWIIDGNYSSTLDIRIKEADTIIYLKRSRMTCLYHVFKRFISYRGKTRPDMQENCPEKLDREFIRWVWQFPKNHEPLIEEHLKDLTSEQTLIKLMNQKEIDDFLNSLENM